MNNKYKKDNLPGHVALLQSLDCILVPGHALPMPTGLGLVQVRYLFCLPPPHVTEQAP